MQLADPGLLCRPKDPRGGNECESECWVMEHTHFYPIPHFCIVATLNAARLGSCARNLKWQHDRDRGVRVKPSAAVCACQGACELLSNLLSSQGARGWRKALSGVWAGENIYLCFCIVGVLNTALLTPVPGDFIVNIPDGGRWGRDSLSSPSASQENLRAIPLRCMLCWEQLVY